jgi:subtilisin family serine protease
VAKSEAVLAAGGAGMILFNQNDGQTQNTDLHFVPSVHINNTDGLVIKDYIDTASAPVAQINGGVFTPIEAPWMAGFSSRGPNRLSGDIIKPDVTAPGVNILAGHSPVNYEADPQGQLFQAISGTSMSSPHVAGLFALLKQAHPDWTPAMAKSALTWAPGTSTRAAKPTRAPFSNPGSPTMPVSSITWVTCAKRTAAYSAIPRPLVVFSIRSASRPTPAASTTRPSVSMILRGLAQSAVS